MSDVRLPASGNIQVRWHAANAFANPARPTPTEINAGLKLANATSWNDLSFGLSASNTTDDPALSAKSNVTDRGAAQYGGAMSFYYPRDFTSLTDEYALVYNALKVPRTVGFITMSIDGELSDTNVATYVGGARQLAAVGDLVDVYKVMTTGWEESITGEEAFRYTVTFLPQGEVYPRTIIGTASLVVVAPATLALAVAARSALTATVDGRTYTRGLRWTSSNEARARVSQNGIVTAVSAGTATITATFKNGNTLATSLVTVS
jgi:hypothetical protein